MLNETVSFKYRGMEMEQAGVNLWFISISFYSVLKEGLLSLWIFQRKMKVTSFSLNECMLHLEGIECCSFSVIS